MTEHDDAQTTPSSYVYSHKCIINLAHDCDKYETTVRIIYSPNEYLKGLHFIFHDLAQPEGSPSEYGVLGQLKTIYYFKSSRTWEIRFENAAYTSIGATHGTANIDPVEMVFLYENIRR